MISPRPVRADLVQILDDFFRLWHLAEEDLLDVTPYVRERERKKGAAASILRSGAAGQGTR
jgi:hypothetical protein